ncbi:hypothetical protein [Nannocystis punicea]|uniref:DUF4178 domain-containing protein n=1 Tax=Nannocystis punicea TaxID=2995304 RepID=A0ABY7GVC8_9BACT|nr:hypothetical protein [Nannocystis poenicansa]WAS90859.1 hypothetical protein O0S08_32120 [Nannocystis poenicansa]
MSRNAIPTGFACPAALRVVQREPWYVATSELVNGEPDQLAGPTRRVKLGERVTYWGLDAASGDSLTVSLGRLDPSEFAAAAEAARAEEPDAELDPRFESDIHRLDGSWRGLGFKARAGAAARAWRDWLATQPEGRQVESFVVGWQAPDVGELAKQPRLLHWTEAERLTLCILGADVDGCWSTRPAQIEYAALDRDEGDEGLLEVRVTDGGKAGWWRYDLATQQWSVRSVKGAEQAGGARQFSPSTERASFPPALAGEWVRSLGDGWAVAGDYDYDSQGLVPAARWLARRHDSTWRLGGLGGDELVELGEWRDPETFALVVGHEDLSSGDGLGYGGRRLSLFRTDGEWLAPAGWLPLPLHGMAMMRREGGWEYEHSLTLAKPGCLAVALRRSVHWRLKNGARRESKLPLPMPSLEGAWTAGPEGLVRGC